MAASLASFTALAFICSIIAVTKAQPGTGPRKLVVVRAGAVATQRDIATLTNTPLRFCPGIEDLSIRCEGRNVRPQVRFYVNGDRVQTEGNKPYHIAGDFDATNFIIKWDDYVAVTPAPDGTRTLSIKCMHKNRKGRWTSFVKPMIIEEDTCSTCPKTGLVISKALVDPTKLGESDSERVVVYNSGVHPIDTSSIVVKDIIGNQRMLGGAIVQPGACSNVLLSGRPILNNNGDTIFLENSCGDMINSVTYTEADVMAAGEGNFVTFDSNCV